MDGRPLYLTGIAPPGNVERTLTDVKRSLFYTYGLVSAMALQALVPLAYSSEPIAKPDPKLLPRSPNLVAGKWVIKEGTIFLSVHPEAELAELAESLGFHHSSREDRGGGQVELPPQPVPPYFGLYVARASEPNPQGSDEQTLLSSLKPPSALRWGQSRLACWELQYAHHERWWDAIVCVEIWSVRLRKRSARVNRHGTE